MDKRKTPAQESAPPVATDKEIISVKGFGLDWKCRDFQFALGESYEVSGNIKACHNGFHAIEGHPLEVFSYYPPTTSRYAIVRQSGAISRDTDDSKIASARIMVEAELKLPDLVKRAWDWVWSHAKLEEGSHATGFQGAASATGGRGAASATGDYGAASATGGRGAASATGFQGAASATGFQGAASATGGRGAASATGGRGAASATGGRGAASATGDYGAASATGFQGAASATGFQGAASATGGRGAASATGFQGAASATGFQGAASATGGRGAASATGDYGAASATGFQGAASATGDYGAASATGKDSAAMASGFGGKAKGADGCALFLVRRNDDWEITHVWAGIVGRDGIKPDQFYTLDENGKPLETSDE